MTYDELCFNNQYLYGLLEQLTIKAIFCIMNGITIDLEALNKRKVAINDQINNNLNEIERQWQVIEMKSAARDAMIIQIKPTAIERKIIDEFITDPAKLIKHIAEKLGVPNKTACNTISKFLKQHYQL